MKIICIGQNYKEHIKEMGSVTPDVPLYFMKPDSSLLIRNRPFYLPSFSKEMHYEAEIVVRINRVGKTISEQFAHRYYNEIAFGIDLTARDLQRQCKEKGAPWEIAKGFDYSAPVSNFYTLDQFQNSIDTLPFSLIRNGKSVQTGNTADMLFSVDQIISYVSTFMTLKIGDLIFTGTPKGVGKLEIGDHLEGYIEEQKLLTMSIR